MRHAINSSRVYHGVSGSGIKPREILGNVDVNFSKGKKGRIIIYKGDAAEDLAANFAKIYSLNEDMRVTLKEMLVNYI